MEGDGRSPYHRGMERDLSESAAMKPSRLAWPTRSSRRGPHSVALCLFGALVACDDPSATGEDGVADALPDDAVTLDGASRDAAPPDGTLTVDGPPDSSGPDGPASDAAGPSPDGPPSDTGPTLHWNEGQARGTHNSTPVAPDRPVHPSHAYTHAPLTTQLAEQGVRQLELDVHHHEDGHFEVFHLPVVDAGTVCQRLSACLDELRAWSEANPAHFPVMVWVEPKDELDFVPPYGPIRPEHYDDLDAELRAGLGPRLFTPDDLRGDHATLPAAVAAGWPSLGAMRGRFLFALLDSGEARDHYLEDHPALAGRAMFANPDGPDDPFAAVFKINNAASDHERVGELARQGFVVTSNIDGADSDDETNAARRDASLAAGAHFLSSDFPAPVEGRAYWFELPGGAPVRCNPITASPDCTAERLE